MSKTTLVIGATGTVGRGVVSELVECGVSVRAATRNPSKYDGPDAAVPVAFDLADPSTFGPALQDAQSVFLVNPAGTTDAKGAYEGFLDSLRQHPGVEKIVSMTAQGVDFSDEIPLRQLELAVEALGRTYVHLRPTWFSQNFNSYWYAPIKAAGVIPVPAADAKTPFIDVRDISAAAAAAIVRDDIAQEAIELTGPVALTYGEAATVLSDVSGRTIRYENIDESSFRASLIEAGLAEDYADLLLSLFVMVRSGATSAVTDGVERLTGRPPRSLEAYAKDHAELFR